MRPAIALLDTLTHWARAPRTAGSLPHCADEVMAPVAEDAVKLGIFAVAQVRKCAKAAVLGVDTRLAPPPAQLKRLGRCLD